MENNFKIFSIYDSLYYSFTRIFCSTNHKDIGILYLIFDLELIFIFPLATILHTLQNPIALLAYLIFMIILTLGFIYEWKKGALKLNL